jgi:hypothetical protein
MKRKSKRVSTPLALAIAISLPCVATTSAQTPVVAASSYATVEVHVNARRIGKQWYAEDAGLSGPVRIAISYGQPHARGRKVEGGLIPSDQTWRLGANTATILHTDVDMILGSIKIPQGDFSLFINSSKAGYELVVNKGTGQWGTDYDKAMDFGRISLSAKTLSDAEESLTIYLMPESTNPSSGYAELKGVLRIKWGKTELSTTWRVD